jgi:DNA end-binding protein Ku
MRYAAELRDARDYFRDIKKVEIDEDSLDLAKQLIKRRAAKFDPGKFVDGYEVALKELVQAKIDHAPVPKDEAAAPPRGKVISLMDALRKSIGDEPTEAAPETKKKPVKGITLVKSAAPAKPKAAAKPAKTAKRKSA